MGSRSLLAFLGSLLLLSLGGRQPLPLSPTGGGTVGVGTANSLAPTPATARISVLHILSDDISYPTDLNSACTDGGGDCSTNMPTLDRLRDNGIEFTHVETTPGCASNRATFLTGRYTFQHGQGSGAGASYDTDSSEVELPQALQYAGSNIKTAVFGKLGLDSGSSDYRKFGFSRYYAREGSIVPNWWSYTTVESGNWPAAATTPTTTGRYAGDDHHDFAVDWLEALDDGETFVLYLWTPFSKNGPAGSYHDPPGSIAPPDDDDDTCENAGGQAACFIEMNRYMDTKIGEVVDAAIAHDPNVLIIFNGDFGRSSAIFAYGDIDPGDYGTSVQTLTDGTDLWPTVMDYVGKDSLGIPDTDRTGVSLRNVLSGNCTTIGQETGCWNGTTDRCVYSSEDTGAGIRYIRCNITGASGYLYTRNMAGGDTHIYENVFATDPDDPPVVDCVDAPCLAAEAILEAEMLALDGLP